MTYNYLGANRALNGAVYIADPTTGVGLKCPGWDNGSYCGTAGHHTSQNRCFAHMHTAPAAFPYQICKMLANGQLQGLEAGPDINSLTGLTLEDTDPIKDYYIDYYAANREAIETDTPSGDVDFTTNCFGYVFGKSTWVNDPQFLFDDDATSEAYPVAGGAGRQGTITHGYKVIAVWDPGASGGEIFPTLKVTKDKFRESQLWREDFASPGRTANAAQHKLK